MMVNVCACHSSSPNPYTSHRPLAGVGHSCKAVSSRGIGVDESLGIEKQTEFGPER